MSENPYTSSQAESDFAKAKQKAWVQSIKSIINPEAGQLLSFHDIKGLLKPDREKYLGMKTVSIADIAGSEDRYQDFSRHFFPKREHLRNRWMSIDKAYLSDIILPPIKLLKLGDMYFVRDGNHRVSVARTQGVISIDAEVVELSSEIQVEGKATRDEILKAVISYERHSVLEQTELDRIIPVEMIEFTSPGRWHEILNHIEGHKYFINMGIEEEITFEDAARSWYNTLYIPIIERIREEHLLTRFPKRTEADLYIWIIKHWHCLKKKYGPEYPLDQAASEFAAVHGKGFYSRMRKRIKAFLGFRN
ncbi:MAG: transcriptional regulator [Spirochaetaceae bacterium]|nr:transcriptional regulator [Spirochaetaceae bacterium]